MIRLAPSTIGNFLLTSVLVLAGCQGSGTGSSAQALSLAEVESSVASGPTLVEVKLDADHHASAIEIEPSHDESISARVVSVDAAGSVALEGGFQVRFDGATRFRTAGSSDAGSAAWLAEIEASLASGTPAYVRASRPLSATPSDPSALDFLADDLRVEDDRGTIKLELLVDADNLQVDGQSGTITLMSHEVSVDDSTELWDGDEDGDELENEAADDNGVDAPGADDNGVDAPASDDNGGA